MPDGKVPETPSTSPACALVSTTFALAAVPPGSTALVSVSAIETAAPFSVKVV